MNEVSQQENEPPLVQDLSAIEVVLGTTATEDELFR